ncbi:MAG: cytochrome P450, partial [Acidimicrobiales bacterium]
MEQAATTRPSVPELVPKEQWEDPHPHYHQIRAEKPIWSIPEWDEYVFTRFDDCERILRDPSMSSDPSKRRMEVPILELAEGMERPRTMLLMDAPDHTRLRKLVSKAFTPRTIDKLRPHVADLIHGMLDQVDRSGFDLIAGLGYPLPVTVICELLGIPPEDQHLFGPWSSDASRMLDADLDDATIQRGLMAFMQLVNYLNGIFEERRAAPRDDLLSALLAAEEEGERLSEEELRSTVVLLFVAGHETTTNLIGNGTVALLRQRSEWERLVADPSLA